MGYYTEFIFKATLKKDTPENIISLLNRVINERDLGHDKVLFDTEDVFKPDLNHEFFKCERWYMLFLCTNWDETMQGSLFYKEKDYWILDIHTEFKNYNGEIDHFIDWITPFIVGRKKKQFVGSWQGEQMDSPINIYIER